jgi:hypothetical protein
LISTLLAESWNGYEHLLPFRFIEDFPFFKTIDHPSQLSLMADILSLRKTTSVGSGKNTNASE